VRDAAILEGEKVNEKQRFFKYPKELRDYWAASQRKYRAIRRKRLEKAKKVNMNVERP